MEERIKISLKEGKVSESEYNLSGLEISEFSPRRIGLRALFFIYMREK